jgi:hypothetical protein
MATTNITVKSSDGWVLVVPSTASDAFVTCITPFGLEVATSLSNNEAPGVAHGHVYNQTLQISRLLFTSGAIWVRIAPSAAYATDASAIIVVDAA